MHTKLDSDTFCLLPLNISGTREVFIHNEAPQGSIEKLRTYWVNYFFLRLLIYGMYLHSSFSNESGYGFALSLEH